ncbi:MAG: collagen-like protein [Flavobacteriales bacterium]|nr:collagen-like protein [Flavobacteriales bacterium]
MKNYIFFLFIAAAVFTSCEGPQGPPGFDGQDGGLFVGQTFERTVNFQYNANSNLYLATLSVETSLQLFDTDAILVYRLENDFPDEWSMIPQNFFLGGGNIMQYVFNHSLENDFRFRINLFIDGNFDLGNTTILGPGFTQNQTFRFVIVPSDFGITSGVDVSDYNAVVNALDLD